ncbi:MAG TPA: EboA domain-containing protein [Umezawaea sp.]|nr:EboA domain-containing protein [Umezawaea sp.]
MTAPRFAYGTNGFADHRLGDALRVIADLGYTGVALTLDHRHLDPFSPTLAADVADLAADLDRLGLAVVVETGARFLLDPWHEDAPTLLHADGEPRLDLLMLALDVAADLGAEAVSFGSGAKPVDVPDDVAWDRLVDGCALLAKAAEEVRVPLGFEPAPGTFVADLDGFDRLRSRLGEPEFFGLALDFGRHRRVPARAGPHLVTVRLRDVPEHLGGGIDLTALDEVGYRGLVTAERPRHGHTAPTAARESLELLRGAHWRADALRRIAADPTAIRTLFPLAGRACGAGPAADVRIDLLAALPEPVLTEEVSCLYLFGDPAEKHAVLRALDLLPVGDTGLPLVLDALRTNDSTLVAAALGSYGTAALDSHAYRRAVLKCVLLGVPLAEIGALRVDDELRGMLRAFAEERVAAGRPVPADVPVVLAEEA